MVKAAVKVTVDCSVGLGLCSNLQVHPILTRQTCSWQAQSTRQASIGSSGLAHARTCLHMMLNTLAVTT